MKMKYFPLTFLGAGLTGAICGWLFCRIFLTVSGLGRPFLRRATFSPTFDVISTSLHAALATAIMSMIFWGIFILLPNRLSAGRGVAAGILSALAAIPIVMMLRACFDIHGNLLLPLNFTNIIYSLLAGLIGVIVVGVMSCGTIFAVGGIAGWLYVLLVRRVFALGSQPLPPPE
jgi:hypothetical protein